MLSLFLHTYQKFLFVWCGISWLLCGTWRLFATVSTRLRLWIASWSNNWIDFWNDGWSWKTWTCCNHWMVSGMVFWSWGHFGHNIGGQKPRKARQIVVCFIVHDFCLVVHQDCGTEKSGVGWHANGLKSEVIERMKAPLELAWGGALESILYLILANMLSKKRTT